MRSLLLGIDSGTQSTKVLVVDARDGKVIASAAQEYDLIPNLPPGAKEQVHSHPAYVIYVLAGGRYRNYAADGKITEGTFQTGDVIYRDPLTHAAENIGDKPMHLILVELKSETGSSASAHP